MKLLRLKIFQETACYLKPFAFKVGETFPLAPFSTVKGMLHAVLDAKEYIPMNISTSSSTRWRTMRNSSSSPLTEPSRL